jgi:[ribosomal protein S5]-alanine N-acetyltransferase
MNTFVSFLHGERITLRALVKEDLNDNYLQWLNDEEVCRGNTHAVFPNTEEKMYRFYEAQQNHMSQVVLAIIHKNTNKHIGNVSLQNINWISRNAEFAIIMGDKEFWGNGLGEEAALLIVQYGFDRLNLHRIYCGTFSNNESMKKLAQKLFMKQEGVRREAVYKNGSYLDVFEFGVLKSEFKK